MCPDAMWTGGKRARAARRRAGLPWLLEKTIRASAPPLRDPWGTPCTAPRSAGRKPPWNSRRDDGGKHKRAARADGGGSAEAMVSLTTPCRPDPIFRRPRGSAARVLPRSRSGNPASHSATRGCAPCRQEPGSRRDPGSLRDAGKPLRWRSPLSNHHGMQRRPERSRRDVSLPPPSSHLLRAIWRGNGAPPPSISRCPSCGRDTN